jgi:hypothetical protein
LIHLAQDHRLLPIASSVLDQPHSVAVLLAWTGLLGHCHSFSSNVSGFSQLVGHLTRLYPSARGLEDFDDEAIRVTTICPRGRMQSFCTQTHKIEEVCDRCVEGIRVNISLFMAANRC